MAQPSPEAFQVQLGCRDLEEGLDDTAALAHGLQGLFLQGGHGAVWHQLQLQPLVRVVGVQALALRGPNHGICLRPVPRAKVTHVL